MVSAAVRQVFEDVESAKMGNPARYVLPSRRTMRFSRIRYSRLAESSSVLNPEKP
jgi:hypothetical protein